MYFIIGRFKNINYKDILNDISLPKVKKAGTILDGCKVNIYFNTIFLKLAFYKQTFIMLDLF